MRRCIKALANGRVVGDKWQVGGAGSWLRPLFAGFFMILALAACSGERAEPSANRAAAIPVAPEFETFYESYGGRRIFGDPITEAFTVEEDGRLLQYFHTMRLEYDESGSIIIYPLGQWALDGLDEPTAEPDETAGAELQAFYSEHNGEQLFGRPLSPLLQENGRLVRYFRNGRLEWHPELAQGEQVQVGFLGQAHFDAEMSFVYYKQQGDRPVPQAGISEANIIAMVRAPILYAGEEQILYITVLTPTRRPVDGITVGLQMITEAKGNGNVQVIGQTDEKGKIVTTLDLEGISPGEQVQLLVLAYAANDTVIDRTYVTFKTWW